LFTFQDAVEETSVAEKRKSVKFARTPIMSTYLVAYAVGDFEYIEVGLVAVFNVVCLFTSVSHQEWDENEGLHSSRQEGARTLWSGHRHEGH